MSAPLKFRAWDTDIKQWVRPGLVSSLDMSGKMVVRTDCIIEQLTGLLDKNGVEIYEGDIVKWKAYVGEVKWYKCGFAVYDFPSPHYPERGWIELNKGFTVIGNVHENKELLK